MLKVVDPHIHFWDLGTGFYPRREERGTGKSAMTGDYLRDDLMADRGDVEILKAVHVEAFPTNGIGEALHLQRLSQAAPDGLPQGIVAYANLAAADVDTILAALAAIPNVRGVRQVLDRYVPHFGLPDIDLLNDAGWRYGFGRLAAHGFSFDLQIHPEQMRDVAELAAANPETSLILNHAGLPFGLSGESEGLWQEGLRTLAACRNVSIKVSGFAMFDPSWTPESIRPYTLAALEAFGTDRVMFASNFPIDKQASTYEAIWSAFDMITDGLGESDRAAVFRENAERIYRL